MIPGSSARARCVLSMPRGRRVSAMQNCVSDRPPTPMSVLTLAAARDVRISTFRQPVVEFRLSCRSLGYSRGMKRRQLQLDSLVAVPTEARRLMEHGYDRAGAWSLGQVCEHLARAIESSMDGFDFAVPWWMRLGAPVGRWMVLRLRWMPAGAPAPRKWVPTDPVDDHVGVERLTRAIERFIAWDKPLHASPLLGHLTRDQWDLLHRLHAAHHLGFLIPNAPD